MSDCVTFRSSHGVVHRGTPSSAFYVSAAPTGRTDLASLPSRPRDRGSPPPPPMMIPRQSCRLKNNSRSRSLVSRHLQWERLRRRGTADAARGNRHVGCKVNGLGSDSSPTASLPRSFHTLIQCRYCYRASATESSGAEMSCTT